MAKRYLVTLSEDERAHLLALTKKGKVAARKLTRAHILLQADAGVADTAMAAALHVGTATGRADLQTRCRRGPGSCAERMPPAWGRRKLEGKQEALLVALACSTPPEERPRWTMQLLADQLVELKPVESISDETVRRTLKKTSSSRG